MSVSKWNYSPEKCDGRPCVGDCDFCNYESEEEQMNNITNSLVEKVIDECIYYPMYRMIMKDRMLRGKTFDEIIDEYFGDISPRARKKRRKQIYNMQKWINHLIDVKNGERKDE